MFGISTVLQSLPPTQTLSPTHDSFVRVCVRGCVRAWVRACMRGCVRAWVRGCVRALSPQHVSLQPGGGGNSGTPHPRVLLHAGMGLRVQVDPGGVVPCDTRVAAILRSEPSRHRSVCVLPTNSSGLRMKQCSLSGSVAAQSLCWVCIVRCSMFIVRCEHTVRCTKAVRCSAMYVCAVRPVCGAMYVYSAMCVHSAMYEMQCDVV